jgi:hypothetical protein
MVGEAGVFFFEILYRAGSGLLVWFDYPGVPHFNVYILGFDEAAHSANGAWTIIGGYRTAHMLL